MTKGNISVNAYLFFAGNCAEAMRFYESVLGGKVVRMMTYAEMPGKDCLAEQNPDHIMHAQLVLDQSILMAADAPEEMTGKPSARKRGFALTLTYPTGDEATRVFNALAEGGQMTMPLQKTFWAEAHGVVVDQFGTPWIINGGMAQG